MSSLIKRKDSPYWFIAFDVRQPDGSTRRFKKSTKKKTKDEALAEAPRIIEKERQMAIASDEENRAYLEILSEAHRSALRGELSEARARELLSRMLKVSVGRTFENYTTRSWSDEWQKRKRPLEKASRKRYETSIRAFLDFLGDKADRRLDQICKADIRRFRDLIYYGKKEERSSHKNGKNIEELVTIRSAVTANHYVADVKSMLAEAVDDGVLLNNPTSGLKPLPEDEVMKRKPYTHDEVKSLVEKSHEEGWYSLVFSKKTKTPRLRLTRCEDWPGMILFSYYTGARLGDIAALTWNNIDFSSDSSTYKPKKTRKRKKSSEVFIPLHADLRKWLEDHKGKAEKSDLTDPVFPSLFNTSTSGKCGLSSQFAAIMEYAEVDRMLVRPASKDVRAQYARGFHSLRHTSNSNLANANVSPELRMLFMGHNSEEVNKVYTHHEIQVMRAAINKLPSF